MKKLIGFHQKGIDILSQLKDLPPLFLRLTLAYGLYEPAMMKWNNFENIVNWFEKMELPLPTLNAYLATYTEVLGFIFLTLGFATRIISIPLIIVMMVAIKTVHWDNGFAAAKNGFEIPFYYMLMLFVLLIMGPGRISLDYLIKKFVK